MRRTITSGPKPVSTLTARARRKRLKQILTELQPAPDKMPRRTLLEFQRWRHTRVSGRKAVVAEQAKMIFRGAPHSSASCSNLPESFPHQAFLRWTLAVARQRWKWAAAKGR